MLDQHGVRPPSTMELSDKVLSLYSAVWMDTQRQERLTWLKEILLVSTLPPGTFTARERVLFVLRQCASSFLDLHCMKLKMLLDQIPDQDFVQYSMDMQSIMYQVLFLTAKHYWYQSFPGRLVRQVSWSDLVQDPIFLELMPRLDLITMSRLVSPLRARVIDDLSHMNPADRDALAWIVLQLLMRHSQHARLDDLETVGRLLGLTVDFASIRTDKDRSELGLCFLLLMISEYIGSGRAASGTPWDLQSISSFIVKTVQSALSQESLVKLFNQPTLITALLGLPLNLSDSHHRRFVQCVIRDLPDPVTDLEGWPAVRQWFLRAIQDPDQKVRFWVDDQIQQLKVPECDKAEIRSHHPGPSMSAPQSQTVSRSPSFSSIQAA